MRALILAAGRGSRMGRLGDERPKCLVELAGHPLLERQVAALRRGGLLAMEIGFRQRDELALLLQDWANVRFVDDYAGTPRVALAEKR